MARALLMACLLASCAAFAPSSDMCMRAQQQAQECAAKIPTMSTAEAKDYVNGLLEDGVYCFWIKYSGPVIASGGYKPEYRGKSLDYMVRGTLRSPVGVMPDALCATLRTLAARCHLPHRSRTTRSS